MHPRGLDPALLHTHRFSRSTSAVNNTSAQQSQTNVRIAARLHSNKPPDDDDDDDDDGRGGDDDDGMMMKMMLAGASIPICMMIVAT